MVGVETLHARVSCCSTNLALQHYCLLLLTPGLSAAIMVRLIGWFVLGHVVLS